MDTMKRKVRVKKKGKTNLLVMRTRDILSTNFLCVTRRCKSQSSCRMLHAYWGWAFCGFGWGLLQVSAIDILLHGFYCTWAHISVKWTSRNKTAPTSYIYGIYGNATLWDRFARGLSQCILANSVCTGPLLHLLTNTFHVCHLVGLCTPLRSF